MSDVIHVVLRANWYAGAPFGRYKTAGPRTTVEIPAKLRPFLPSTAKVFDKPMTARDFINQDPSADEFAEQADLYDADLSRANSDEEARLMAEAEANRIANLEKKMGIEHEEKEVQAEEEPKAPAQKKAATRKKAATPKPEGVKDED